ncbi:unnamed protein product [Aspergillus oryzae RIB40]|uniref:DNA, SC113 n=1 Tax=Aspergillus oryzae (strain ATCC 42149 / RIB 40) TaxID=510516 RepID=Q2U5T8_ASPOR|nr:unnamed protein product [Aspergillus oryzae RIB40]BAE63077.1 unnamed protein product [Aspergillus oryzae RIB40]
MKQSTQSSVLLTSQLPLIIQFYSKILRRHDERDMTVAGEYGSVDALGGHPTHLSSHFFLSLTSSPSSLSLTTFLVLLDFLSHHLQYCSISSQSLFITSNTARLARSFFLSSSILLDFSS